MKYNEKEMAQYSQDVNAVPVKEGFLYKQGENGSGGWKLRWFCLKGNVLFYFKARDASTPIGFIFLEQSRVEPLSSCGIEWSFQIIFEGTGARSYNLYAHSESDMIDWMGVLRQASYELVLGLVHVLQRQIVSLGGSDPLANSNFRIGDVEPSQPAEPLLLRLHKAQDNNNITTAIESQRPLSSTVPRSQRVPFRCISQMSSSPSPLRSNNVNITRNQVVKRDHSLDGSQTSPAVGSCDSPDLHMASEQNADCSLEELPLPFSLSLSPTHFLLSERDVPISGSSSPVHDILVTDEDEGLPKAVELTFVGKNLANPFTEACNIAPSPCVLVFKRAPGTDDDSDQWIELARTEVVAEERNPDFVMSTVFESDVVVSSQLLKFSAYHHSSRDSEVASVKRDNLVLIGQTKCTIEQILRGGNHKLTIDLQTDNCSNDGDDSSIVHCGTLIVQANKVLEETDSSMQMRTTEEAASAQQGLRPCTTAVRRRSEAFSGLPNSMLVPNGKTASTTSALSVAITGSANVNNTAVSNPSPRPVMTKPITRTYRFQTGSGRRMKVIEEMFESVYNFVLPYEFLKLLINDDRKRIIELENFNVSGKNTMPVWQRQLGLQLDQLRFRVKAYERSVNYLSDYVGPNFKASAAKKDPDLMWISTNCHVQRMRVVPEDAGRNQFLYDIITFGAPSVHSMGYKRGGLRRLLMECHEEEERLLGPSLVPQSDPQMLASFSASLNDLVASLRADNDALIVALKNQDAAQLASAGAAVDDHVQQLVVLLDARQLDAAVSLVIDTELASKVSERGTLRVFNEPRHFVVDVDGLWDAAGLVTTAVKSAVQFIAGAYTNDVSESVICDGVRDASAVLSSLIESTADRAHAVLVKVFLRSEAGLCCFPDVAARRDAVMSQGLTALVDSFMCKLDVHGSSTTFWAQMRTVGFLASFESLLSTAGDEQGMLEDMITGVEDLVNVSFVVEPSKAGHTYIKLDGCRNNIVVRVFFHLKARRSSRGRVELVRENGKSLGGPPKLEQLLGPKGCVTVVVFPILFTQGVNENQTVANTFGDNSLQDVVNWDSFNRLNAYYELYRHFRLTSMTVGTPDVVEQLHLELTRLDSLLEQVKALLNSHKAKNIELLMVCEDVVRRMHGGRLTSCKSAKDRTGMSVTLEQCLVLTKHHDLERSNFVNALDLMRSEGTRRENCYKNIGERQYAFNTLQMMYLPRLYRPPKVTACASKT